MSTPLAPVVGVAASAGGPAALAAILPSIAGLAAPVLVVQHLDPRFVKDFMEWMARVSPLPVEVPEDGVLLRAGTVYIAAPGVHLKLGVGGRAVLDPSPPRPHCPSADELFLSMASNAGRKGIGVILTGIGDDGAVGLLGLHRAGGTTVVQDRESSAVYGMPLAAGRLVAADHVLPLSRIAATVQAAVRALGP
jgi:two-component system chemotaxis response regulator CheB